MTRAGLGLALIVAVLVALGFDAATQSIADKLEGHIAPRSDNIEAASRISGLGQAWAANGFDHFSLLPVLGAGSEIGG